MLGPVPAEEITALDFFGSFGSDERLPAESYIADKIKVIRVLHVLFCLEVLKVNVRFHKQLSYFVLLCGGIPAQYELLKVGKIPSDFPFRIVNDVFLLE